MAVDPDPGPDLELVITTAVDDLGHALGWLESSLTSHRDQGTKIVRDVIARLAAARQGDSR